MSTKRINANPRFTRYLVASRAFDGNRVTAIDIGARGGFEWFWDLYGDQVDLIGFEPDREECARLNQQGSSSQRRYFPVALHLSKGRKPFHKTLYAAGSGFYRPNQKFLSRFPWGEVLPVKEVVELETTDLDSFLAEQGIENVDFVKLDIEGAELDVLKGATRTLGNVLALSLEVVFVPVLEGGPLFSDLDQFLRKQGFTLYDLQPRYHPRKTLSQNPFPSEFGQLAVAQVVYLRDAVEEIGAGQGIPGRWDESRLLKLASFMELVSQPDSAIELLQFARDRGLLTRTDVGNLIDLLVPSSNGRPLSFDQYWEKIRNPAGRGGFIRRGAETLRRLAPSSVKRAVRSALLKSKRLIEVTLEG